MSEPRGRFITFEGGDGAGKTTQIEWLSQSLSQSGVRVVRTREPGGTPGAEAIRELTLSGQADRWTAVSEALLMYAARADHVERLILPALARGDWVLCDRFLDSTLVYQGYAGGLDLGRVAAMRAAALGGFAPDLTLILDIDPVEGERRIHARGDDLTRFEGRGAAYARADGFLAVAEAEPDRCAVIDAARDAEAVAEEISEIVTARLTAP